MGEEGSADRAGQLIEDGGDSRAAIRERSGGANGGEVRVPQRRLARVSLEGGEREPPHVHVGIPPATTAAASRQPSAERAACTTAADSATYSSRASGETFSDPATMRMPVETTQFAGSHRATSRSAVPSRTDQESAAALHSMSGDT